MSRSRAPLRFCRRGGATPAIIAVLATMLVALGWGVFQFAFSSGDDAGAASAEWNTVQKRSFDLTVIATGEVEAKDQREIKCEVEGTATISWIIEEGTRVKTNDLLVKLADETITQRIEEETLSVEKAKEAEIAARQQMAIDDSEAKSLLDAAKVELEMFELDLQKWENGDVPQKRRELDLALEKARRNLERAGENVQLSQQLYDEQFISKQELEDDKLKLLEAQEALKTAELDIAVYNDYTWHKEKRKSESDVSQAKGKLERTISKNEGTLAQSKAALESAVQTLRIRQERMANLKKQLEASEVKAPKDGMVIYATTVGSRRYYRSDPIGQGSKVQFNETLLYLPDTTQMVAALKVHEAMLRYVQIGHKVNVTVDALPGKPLTGTVSNIGVMAEKGNWLNPNLREYLVRVDLPANGEAELKPGMRCAGTVMVGHVKDAVAVPIQAVHSDRAEQFCYLAEAGRVRRTPVKIGRASETLVEVLEGVKVGDQVLLRRPHAGEVINPKTSSDEDENENADDADADSTANPPNAGDPSRPPGAGERQRPEGPRQPRDGNAAPAQRGEKPKENAGDAAKQSHQQKQDADASREGASNTSAPTQNAADKAGVKKSSDQNSGS